MASQVRTRTGPPADRPADERPARPAPVPPSCRQAGHDRAHVGRAARDDRRRDPGRAARRRLVALPARSRRRPPDPRRNERTRSLPDRSRTGAVRRRGDRPRRRVARADADRRRPPRSALPVGPRHRPAAVHRLDAVGPAVVARGGRRRAEHPDRGDPRLQRLGRRPSCRRSPTSSPGSSRRAARSARPRRRSRRSRRSTRPAAELIAMVTHELRTPLAVVRAYTDLLSEEPPLVGRESRDMLRAPDAATSGTTGRSTRSSGSTGWSTRSSPRSASARGPAVGRGPGRRRRACSTRSSAGSAPLLRNHRVEVDAGIRRFALADPPRLRQILEHLVENAVKYAPPGTDDQRRRALHEGIVRIGVVGRGAGHPGRVAGADLRALRPARHAHRPRLGDRAVRRQAAGRIDGRPPVVRAGRAGRARAS